MSRKHGQAVRIGDDIRMIVKRVVGQFEIKKVEGLGK